MDPIAEEQDFAFTNLVYTEVGSTNTGLQYENVEEGSGHKYENVGQEATKYENVDNTSRYENVPNTDPARPCYQNVNITSENQNDKMSEENQNPYENVGTDDTKSDINDCEHYENYDFGENGVYQNILFTTKPSTRPDTDVYSQLKSLEEAVSRVNDILMKESVVECDDKHQASLSDSTELDQCIQEVTETSLVDKDEDPQKRSLTYGDDSKSKGKVSSLRDMFNFGKNKEPTRESADDSKNQEKQPKQEKSEQVSKEGSVRPTSMFRRWAFARADHPVIDVKNLARAEHPVIDVEKLEDKPSALFSSTEREIVAKFLENVKSELSTV